MRKNLFFLLLSVVFATTAMAQQPNKMYTVTTSERGGWAVNNDGTAFVGYGHTPVASEEQKNFAFVTYQGSTYIYSVYAKKFVKKDATLTDDVDADAVQIEDLGGTYFFKFDDTHNINLGGSKQMTIDTWNTKDAGNQFTLTEQGDFDATQALAIFTGGKVTLGNTVTKLSELNENDLYTFYIEAPESYTGKAGDLSDASATGPGNVYLTLAHGAYSVGTSKLAAARNVIQLIPAENDGEFYIYQPYSEVFIASAYRWGGNWNGLNGWQYAYNNPVYMQAVKLTERADGEFELSYVMDWYYDANNVKVTEEKGEGRVALPATLYIGYDMRGSLKVFAESTKIGLEKALASGQNGADGLYAGLGFNLPVDFGFKINKVTVEEGLITPITKDELISNQASALRDLLAADVETAQGLLDKYNSYMQENGSDMAEDCAAVAEELAGVVADANKYIDNESGSYDEITTVREDLKVAIIEYVSTVITVIGEYEFGDDGYQQNSWYSATFESGKFPSESQAMAKEVQQNAYAALDAYDEGNWTSISDAVTALDGVWGSRVAFLNTQIVGKTAFPGAVGNGETVPGSRVNNNQIWKQLVLLEQPTDGVRLTFLKNTIGSAGSGGLFNGYPMIALGEIEIYDGKGQKVQLTAESFGASSWEMNEYADDTEGAGVKYLCDGKYGYGDGTTAEDAAAAGSYYHSPWGTKNEGGNTDSYVWIDIDFGKELSEFYISIISRDIKTSNGQVSLFPTQYWLSNNGEAYDPLLFAPNPNNAAVDLEEGLITSVSQITDDGLYAIRGLVKTHPTFGLDDEGNVVGTGNWYTDNDWYHKSAVNSDIAFFIKKAGDDVYNIHSLATGKYWPSVYDAKGDSLVYTGYVKASTPYPFEAAKLHIVPAEGDAAMANTFVIYEYHENLTEVIKKGLDANEQIKRVSTPYAVYMDWQGGGLAVRAVQNAQPGSGVDFDDVALNITTAEMDATGDSLHFNKKNGEGQWKIYKLTMDNPYSYWVANLVNTARNIGYRLGTEPGHVADLGNFPAALEAAQKCANDTVSAAAAKETTAKETSLALYESMEAFAAAETSKNPMVAGSYVMVSALPEYFIKQSREKLLYDDGALKWGSGPAEISDEYIWEFTASPYAEQFQQNGTITADEAKRAYNIKNKATGYYISVYTGDGAIEKSVPVTMASDAANAETFVANIIKGSSALSFSPVFLKDASLHTNAHGNGAGSGADVVYWNNDAVASQWYLVSADNYTNVEDLVVEGSEVVSVTCYTVNGAVVPAPVKGINIVKTVYANGVVETKKILVK